MSDNIPAQSAWAELKNMFAPRHKFLVDHLDAKRRLGEATLRIYQQTEPTRNIHPLSHAAKDLLVLTLHRVYTRVWEVVHRKKPCKGAPPSAPLLNLHLEDPKKVSALFAPDEFAAAMRLVSVRGLSIDLRTSRVTTPISSSQSAKDHGMATTGMSTEMPLFVTFAKGMLKRFDVKTSVVFPYYLLASSSYVYSDKADAALALFSPSLTPETRANMIEFMRKNDKLVFDSTEQWQNKFGDEWIVLAAQLEVDLPKRPCDLPLARMGVPPAASPSAVATGPPNAELAPPTPPRVVAPAPPQRTPVAAAPVPPTGGPAAPQEAQEEEADNSSVAGDESEADASGSEQEEGESSGPESEADQSDQESKPAVDKDVVNVLQNRRKAVAGTNDDGSANETDPIASKYKGPYRHHQHGAPPKGGRAFYNYMEHAKNVKHAGTQLIGPKRGADDLEGAATAENDSFLNPLAGNRWEGLFSNPEAQSQELIIDKVKVVRVGKYIPTTRALLSDGSVYRFYVSWVDDDSLNDPRAESVGLESPHRPRQELWKTHHRINSFGTTRTAERAFILGRLLTEAGIIGSSLDAWAKRFLESDAYKIKMAEQEAEEKAEREEYERQRLEREQKNKLDADAFEASAAAARRSAAAKKAAITRAKNKKAATAALPATPAPAASATPAAGGDSDAEADAKRAAIEARVKAKTDMVRRMEDRIATLKKNIDNQRSSPMRDDYAIKTYKAELAEYERDLENEKEELYELSAKLVW